MNEESEYLFELMSKVSGETLEAIKSKERRRPLPACRYLIGMELVRRGYRVTRAARCIGIDHATFLHGRKMMEDLRISPQRAFKEEQDIDINFRQALIEYGRAVTAHKRQ